MSACGGFTDDVEICKLEGLGPGESWPTFNPDGQLAAIRNPKRVKVWNLSREEPVVLLDLEQSYFAFSPDSRKLATRDESGTVTLYELPSCRQLRQFRTEFKYGVIAFDPAAKQLAIGEYSSTLIQIRSAATGAVRKNLPSVPGLHHLCWHPDGKTLATVGADRIIQIWDVASGKPTVQLAGHKGDGIQFEFSHSGSVLASAGWDAVLHLWDPRTGEQLFTSRQTPMVSLQFRDDDRQLGLATSASGKLDVLELAPVEPFYRTLVRNPAYGKCSYFVPSISPDGRLIAVGLSDGVGIWDVTTGQPLSFLSTGLTYAVQFEPTGSLLTSGSEWAGTPINPLQGGFSRQDHGWFSNAVADPWSYQSVRDQS